MPQDYGTVEARQHELLSVESATLLGGGPQATAASDVIGKPLRKTIRIIAGTMNIKTVLVTGMTVLTTVLSHRFGISLSVSTDFIGVAVMFPIGIGINGAFNRREDALKCLASIKGNAFAIRLAFSHWVEDRPGRSDLAAHVEQTLQQLMGHIKAFLTPADFNADAAWPVMQAIAELSRAGEALRKEGVPSPELAQLNERVREISVQFEGLKNIRIYRTPIAMRGYSKLLIFLFPFIFGPTFNTWSNEQGSSIWHGIVLAVVYSVVLTGLDNVQEALENPFDGDGLDDIQFYEPSFVLHGSI